MLTRPSDFHCFGELELGPWPALAHMWGPGTWAEIISIAEPQSRQITLLDFAGIFWPKKVQKYFYLSWMTMMSVVLKCNTILVPTMILVLDTTTLFAKQIQLAAKSFVGIWVEALWAILCLMCWICNFLIWRWDRRNENFVLFISRQTTKSVHRS